MIHLSSPGVPGVVSRGAAVGGGRKPLVSATAATALGNDHLLTRFGQVAEHIAAIAVVDERTWGNFYHQLASHLAVGLVAGAGAAIGRARMLAMHDSRQAVRVGQGANDNVAAIAAVAAVRTAFGDILLAPKAAGAVAAVAAFDVHHHSIDEHN